MNIPSFIKQQYLPLYLLMAVLLVYRLLICFSYTPELSFGEANNIWNALNVANGKSMYSNPVDTPFEIFQYTPLSQLPTILSAYLFNSNSSSYYYNVTVVGRLFSLSMNILTFFLVFKILFKQFKISRLLSMTGALVGFALLTQLAFAVRPDAMALCLTIYALYLFGKAHLNESVKSYYYSAIVFAIAFFAKQDSILIISAVGLTLLLQREFKHTLLFSIAFLVSLGGLLFLFGLIHGDYFYVSIFGGLDNGTSLAQAHGVFEHYLRYYGVLFFIGVFFTFYLLRSNMENRKRVFLICLGSLSLLISIGTSFKYGSWINYYTLTNIVLVSVIFVGIAHLNTGKEKAWIERNVVWISSLVIVFYVFTQAFHYTSPFLKYGQGKQRHQEISEAITDFSTIAQTDGLIIYTAIPQVKLLLFRNSILPNYEYYPVSSFSTDGYLKLKKEQRLTHVIMDDETRAIKESTFSIYGIDGADFKQAKMLGNYMLLENGSR